MNPQGEQEERQEYRDEVQTGEVDKTLLGGIVEETQKRQANDILIEEQRFVLQQRRAKMFSLSGLFPDKDAPPGSVQGVARAMVKIELGESMGFSAAEALQGIYVINGQTAVAAALRAARMQAAGYDWDLNWHGTEENCTGCTLWLKLNGKPLMVPKRNDNGDILRDQNGDQVVEQARSWFKKADAERMLTTMWVDNVKKRVSILEKENWRMSPRNMYFARAVTNAQRFYAPKVLSVNLLSVEEAMDLDQVVERTEERRAEQVQPRGSRQAQKDMADLLLKINALIQQGKIEEAKELAKGADIAWQQFEPAVEYYSKRNQAPTEPTTHHHAKDSNGESGGPSTTASEEPSTPKEAPTVEESGKASDGPSPDLDAMRLDQMQSLSAYEERFKVARKPARFWDILMTTLGTNDLAKAPWEQSFFMAAVRALEEELKKTAAPRADGPRKLNFGEKP